MAQFLPSIHMQQLYKELTSNKSHCNISQSNIKIHSRFSLSKNVTKWLTEYVGQWRSLIYGKYVISKYSFR